MIYFPDKTLHRYTQTTDGTGVYGETVTSYTYADDILCDFQNETNAEYAQEYGLDLQNVYKIYVDESSTIHDTDKLHDDDGNIYHIIGQIEHYTKFHHYKRVHIVRERRGGNS